MLYELPDFEYYEPRTLAQALEVLDLHKGKAKILAGGTDLLGLMKDRISGAQMPIPEALVNVKKIPELHSVVNSAKESTVGACVTLSEISEEPTLSSRFPGFAQAAHSVGTNQIRNSGTLGGNLCQRPWCWYFRHPAYDCFKKGGKQCFAVAGDSSTYFSVFDLGVCIMAHPSDTAPALISLGATVRIASLEAGEKHIPLSEFFLGPRNVQDNVLKPDELLVSVTIPNVEGRRSVYLKQRTRNNWDFALASVAATGRVEGGTLSSLDVVLGGVAPLPHVVRGIDKLVTNSPFDDRARAEVSKFVTQSAKPLQLNKYKIRMVKGLVGRALDSLIASQRYT